MSTPSAPETQELTARIQRGETGYVLLTTGGDGFAQVGQLLAGPPAEGDYLKIAQIWHRWTPARQPGAEATSAGYDIIFPFDRYYMNEAAAPEAQNRYAQTLRRDAASEAWLTVRVKDGIGVIEGLFIDGVPIEQLVRASPEP